MANYTSAHTGVEIDAAITVAKTVFLDSINGSDGNDGLTPDTPVQTAAAANTLLEDGNTLRVARNSVVYNGNFGTRRHLTVRPYGSGRRPIFTAAKEIPSVSWSLHSGNIYKATVTHDVATTGTTDPAFYCQFAMFDDKGDSFLPARLCGLERITADDGSNRALATDIASMIAGSFTVRRNGADDSSPFATSGTTFDYYVWLADGSNPGSNGRTVRYVEQRSTASFDEGCDIEGFSFCRAGGKDHVSGGSGGNNGSVGRMHDIRIVDASVHGSVVRCSTYTKYYAEKNPYASFGGAGNGLHLYRSESVDGISLGAWCDDIEIVGFETGILCHGDGSEPGASQDAFEQWELGHIKVRDCGLGMQVGEVGTDVHVKSFHASGGYLDRGPEGNRAISSGTVRCIVDDFSFYSQTFPNGAEENILALGGNVTINNGWCYIQPKADGATPSLAVATGGGTIILRNFTVLSGPLFTVTYSNDTTLEAYDSILGEIGYQGADITAGNCMIKWGTRTLAGIQAVYSGVGNDCYAPYYEQPYSHTFTAGEISTESKGTATITAGAAYFLSSLSTLETVQNILVAGADGSGGALKIQGITRDAGNDAGGKFAYTCPNIASYPASVTDAAVTAPYTTRTYFDEDMGTARLYRGATTNVDSDVDVTVSDLTKYTAGQLVRLGGFAAVESLGLFKIASITGTTLNGEAMKMTEVIQWRNPLTASSTVPYRTTTQNYGPFGPTVKISFGFPILIQGGGVEPGIDGTITYSTGGTLDFNALRAGDVGRLNPAGAQYDGDYVLSEQGAIPNKIRVGEGDSLDMLVKVYVAEWDVEYSGNPVHTRLPILQRGTVPSDAGMGWRYIAPFGG